LTSSLAGPASKCVLALLTVPRRLTRWPSLQRQCSAPLACWSRYGSSSGLNENVFDALVAENASTASAPALSDHDQSPLLRPMPARSSPRRSLPALTPPLMPSGSRVKIWITPPIASAPYRLLAGPRSTSMRSICASGRCSSALVPVVAELTRTPSISTTTWLVLLPRRNTPLGCPGPPVMLSSAPAWRCSSSARPTGPARAIWSASITTRSATGLSAACGTRLAVTTT
jgi:hypothetical protein